MIDHILYVHIPKTAGTSFRMAAQEYYGSNHVFWDYGVESQETSQEVIDTVYNLKEPYRFYSILSDHPYSFLSGHFHLAKYIALYDTLNVVSFVRDPVRQVVSHFNHFCTQHSYDKPLSSFIQEPRFINIQSKHLGHRHIGLLGFLGLCEKFEESIILFNDNYGTKLESSHLNSAHDGAINYSDIDCELIDRIQCLNENDLKLYKSACELFDIRCELNRLNKPFTHGFVHEISCNNIRGCAFQRMTDDPVEIDIYIRDHYITTILAKDYRPGLVNQGVPRRGFVGFEYNFKYSDIKRNEIRCLVKDTGQEIV